MYSKNYLVLLFFLTVMLSISPIYAVEIPLFTIMTEEWEPYNFKKDGVVKGISTDMLVLMLKRVGSKQGRKDILLLPWARAYNMIQRKPGTILFTTTRTQERENMFKWVGPIIEVEFNLYALKKRHINIRSVADIKKYKIGTLREDVVESLLIKKTGMKVTDFERVASSILNIKKLHAGRVDMVPQSRDTTMNTCRETGLNPDEFEPVYTLEKKSMYYAFHKDSSDDVITMFQSAFDELKKEGELAEFFRKYKK